MPGGPDPGGPSRRRRMPRRSRPAGRGRRGRASSSWPSGCRRSGRRTRTRRWSDPRSPAGSRPRRSSRRGRSPTPGSASTRRSPRSARGPGGSSLAAYGLVWLLFAIPYPPPARRRTATARSLQGILTVVLLFGLLCLASWSCGPLHPDPARAGRALTTLLVVPVIVLLGDQRAVPAVRRIDADPMLALRPYLPLRMVLTICGRCFSEDPDREIDYETDILQGNLVAMDGAVYLRRMCRRGHGEVMSLYEEDHAPLGGAPALAHPHPRDHPRHARQHAPHPDGLHGRARRPADAAQLHPPDRRHRELQPPLPDLLRRQRPRDQPARPAAAHRPLARHRDRARRGTHRRPDALGRRADRPPGDRRDHPRPRRIAR